MAHPSIPASLLHFPGLICIQLQSIKGSDLSKTGKQIKSFWIFLFNSSKTAY